MLSINGHILRNSTLARGGAVVKNLPANAGDSREANSILGLERSLGEGNGNPFQYSCLKNSMDRGAWQTTLHEAAESQTQLSTHTHYSLHLKVPHIPHKAA